VLLVLAVIFAPAVLLGPTGCLAVGFSLALGLGLVVFVGLALGALLFFIRGLAGLVLIPSPGLFFDFPGPVFSLCALALRPFGPLSGQGGLRIFGQSLTAGRLANRSMRGSVTES
jgi:hypothetical protein